ncbi:hypothetical protein HK104_010897 [Borealophlyctis nickersoniae]|nr:hypothetical protein HK104_010897 [Borealophlyctis nickersoniae]
MNLRTAALIVALIASGATEKSPTPSSIGTPKRPPPLPPSLPPSSRPFSRRPSLSSTVRRGQQPTTLAKSIREPAPRRPPISYVAHDFLATVYPQQSRTFDNALKAFLVNLMTEEHVDQGGDGEERWAGSSGC